MKLFWINETIFTILKTELKYNIIMNDIEILTDILSKVALHANYMLILNDCEAKAYKGGRGEWYIQNEVTGDAIALDKCEDFSWANDIVFFYYRGEEFYLQLVKVVYFNQFRFAKR